MFIRLSMLAVVLATLLLGSVALAETVKASSWVGRVVVTEDGELLGRVEDLAVDVAEQKVKFVVVSIGSFLIDDNLIAVDPKALGEAADERYLVVYADNLDSARRFGANNWPDVADVLPSSARRSAAVEVVPGADIAAAEGDKSQATISDGRRTATLKSGDRNASIEQTGGQTQDVQGDKVQPKRYTRGSADAPLLADSEFERLDDNSDGYLSRSEIGERLNQGIRYQDYDLDGNDGIDPFEFQLLKNRG